MGNRVAVASLEIATTAFSPLPHQILLRIASGCDRAGAELAGPACGTMMLSNPKSPKRGPGHSGRRRVSPQTACIALFIVINLSWFLYSLLAMGKKRHARQGAVGYKPVDIGRAGRLGEPRVDTDATQTGASQHPAGGLGHSDPTGAQPTGGSSTGVVVGHPEGGLYQARGAGGAPSNARAAQLEDGTVDELVR